MGADAAVLYSGYGYPAYGYAGLGYHGLGYAGLGCAAPAVVAAAPAVVAAAPAVVAAAPAAVVHNAVLGTADLPPCTLWLTLTWEPCTPAMWECALTTWESRCPARQTLV